MNPSTRNQSNHPSVDRLIAFSISCQREELLARGLGLGHLRELLLDLARPLLRQGASLAYGGSWEEMEGNFTFDLLDLIKAVQEDHNPQGPDTGGTLYNHSAWPYYLRITPELEARWADSCRIIRVTQEDAGFAGDEVLSSADPAANPDRFLFNRAHTLAAMRRIMAEGCNLPPPAPGPPARVPGVSARIIIGGKTDGYAGMIPGIFEETLLALRHRIPLYLLGGFGGGAGLMTKGLLAKPGESIPELTYDHHRRESPEVARLSERCGEFRRPSDLTPESLFADFDQALRTAAADFPGSLANGLDDDENRTLLTTSDIREARRLVLLGLARVFNMPGLVS